MKNWEVSGHSPARLSTDHSLIGLWKGYRYYIYDMNNINSIIRTWISPLFIFPNPTTYDQLFCKHTLPPFCYIIITAKVHKLSLHANEKKHNRRPIYAIRKGVNHINSGAYTWKQEKGVRYVLAQRKKRWRYVLKHARYVFVEQDIEWLSEYNDRALLARSWGPSTGQ